jgi:lipoprotein-anchoring transpeptidase ErfK/SrfK
VIAFQKVNGLLRDGIVGPQTWGALKNPQRPLPLPKYNGSHTDHSESADVIRVKLSELILILEKNQEVVKRYPIAGPASSNPYPLPLVGTLTKIEFDPFWYPTAETRAAIRKRGIILPAVIRPGDSRNAMGAAKFIIDFGNQTRHPVRIHGTNEPASIGRRVSRGCIRMHDRHILELAETIENASVKVIIES